MLLRGHSSLLVTDQRQQVLTDSGDDLFIYYQEDFACYYFVCQPTDTFPRIHNLLSSDNLPQIIQFLSQVLNKPSRV